MIWSPTHHALLGGLALLMVLGGCDASYSDLHAAASAGDVARVKGLVASQAALDARDATGATPLWYAAQAGHAEVVAMLLEAGADPNVPVMDRSLAPIHVAAMEGREEVIGALIKGGADMELHDASGLTALRHGITARDMKVIEQLIEAGAVPTEDFRGHSVLHHAAAKGLPRAIQLLVEKGADVNMQWTPSGMTPLHMAEIYGHESAAAMLRSLGADDEIRDANGLRPTDEPADLAGRLFRDVGRVFVRKTEDAMANGE